MAVVATPKPRTNRSGFRTGRRPTGIVGYASAYLFMFENYFEVEPLFPFRYDWGLIGAIPAVICSFVTERLEIPV